VESPPVIDFGLWFYASLGSAEVAVVVVPALQLPIPCRGAVQKLSPPKELCSVELASIAELKVALANDGADIGQNGRHRVRPPSWEPRLLDESFEALSFSLFFQLWYLKGCGSYAFLIEPDWSMKICSNGPDNSRFC
jgi:hypothetical protein